MKGSKTLKKANRKLTYHKRGIKGLCLSSNDKIYASKLLKIYKKALVNLMSSENFTLDQKKEQMYFVMLLRRKYLSLITAENKHVPCSKNKHRTIDSFEERQYWSYFKFTREDLHRLQKELLFQKEFIFANGTRMPGEEVFLRGLYELRTGQNQFFISEEVFGGDQPLQSRAFTCFIDHIFGTFFDLVSNNLQWWNDKGYIDKSREAITQKLTKLGLNFDETNEQEICAFIDCNCLETPRVLHGPAQPGKNAIRWNDTIAEAFYNGKLKHMLY